MNRSVIAIVLVACTGIVTAGNTPLPARPPGPFFPLESNDHDLAESFERGQPIVGATYFYWYDAKTRAHIADHDGSDALTTHPADMETISFKSATWHERQLRDTIDAGLDFLMPVYWGVPGDYEGWSFVGLPPLVEAHAKLEAEGVDPPAIGMFYDTSILQWNNSGPNGRAYHVDLTTEFGRQWFYTPIRDFFSLIPPARWARIDGRPIVFLYAAGFAARQDPPRQFAYVREQFENDFGIEPFIVKNADWKGQADAEYSWGGAVKGPLIFRETIALGPGYDHSAVPGRQPLVVDRQDGRTYIDRWTQALQLDPKRRPWLVHVETWNEWHEGTDIADSREYGRSYIVLTRLFSDLWHTGTRLRLPSGYASAARVLWEPGRPKGLSLRSSSGDGNWRRERIEGVEAVVTVANPHSQISRYLYFNVDDAYAYNLLEHTAEFSVTYRDVGCSQFAVEYDSMVPEGVFDGAFRPGGTVLIGGTGQWKTARFELLDCRFMNRANGADLRLVVTGGNLELAVRSADVCLTE